jgi:hypothetical protein
MFRQTMVESGEAKVANQSITGMFIDGANAVC